MEGKEVILGRWLRLSSSHARAKKFVSSANKPLLEFPVSRVQFCIPNSGFSSKASFNCYCLKKKAEGEYREGFSVLDPNGIPWERGSTWSTMAMYFFFLHIPVGYGGLSIISYILRQPNLDPQTEVLALLAVETLELIGTLLLLKRIAKPSHDLSSFFEVSGVAKERNWLLATALGFILLVTLTLFTTAIVDNIYDYKAIHNAEVNQIMASSDASKAACFILYCVIAPVMEELVYRGFLLSSLASTMSWNQALIISSALFSAAHFSGENFLQLFVIGCVLGCSYSWSGNLTSSIAMHSLYNALALAINFLS